MRRLLSALMFTALLATPSLASADDGRDRWNDRDRREWRDHDRRDRHWRDERRWSDRRHWRGRDWRRDRWHDRRHWRNSRYGYYDRRRIVCRTYWDYGYPERVCWRR